MFTPFKNVWEIQVSILDFTFTLHSFTLYVISALLPQRSKQKRVATVYIVRSNTWNISSWHEMSLDGIDCYHDGITRPSVGRTSGQVSHSKKLRAFLLFLHIILCKFPFSYLSIEKPPVALRRFVCLDLVLPWGMGQNGIAMSIERAVVFHTINPVASARWKNNHRMRTGPTQGLFQQLVRAGHHRRFHLLPRRLYKDKTENNQTTLYELRFNKLLNTVNAYTNC